MTKIKKVTLSRSLDFGGIEVDASAEFDTQKDTGKTTVGGHEYSIILSDTRGGEISPRGRQMKPVLEFIIDKIQKGELIIINDEESVRIRNSIDTVFSDTDLTSEVQSVFEGKLGKIEVTNRSPELNAALAGSDELYERVDECFDALIYSIDSGNMQNTLRHSKEFVAAIEDYLTFISHTTDKITDKRDIDMLIGDIQENIEIFQERFGKIRKKIREELNFLRRAPKEPMSDLEGRMRIGQVVLNDLSSKLDRVSGLAAQTQRGYLMRLPEDLKRAWHDEETAWQQTWDRYDELTHALEQVLRHPRWGSLEDTQDFIDERVDAFLKTLESALRLHKGNKGKFDGLPYHDRMTLFSGSPREHLEKGGAFEEMLGLMEKARKVVPRGSVERKRMKALYRKAYATFHGKLTNYLEA